MKLEAASLLSLAALAAPVFAQNAHPTLPERWIATTNEPGVGIGVEAYKFVLQPTPENPSAMWSNYTDKGCERLIYSTYTNQMRYLFGCDALDCCYEEMSGNQIEFQIPNIHGVGAPDVEYARADVTTSFETVTGADTWSWTFAPPFMPKYNQTWTAVTTNEGSDDSTLVLHSWRVRTPFAPDYSDVSIDFKDYKTISADEQDAFDASFAPPADADCRLSCGNGFAQGKLSKKNYDFVTRPSMLDVPTQAGK